jgi:hypothetical protein
MENVKYQIMDMVCFVQSLNKAGQVTPQLEDHLISNILPEQVDSVATSNHLMACYELSTWNVLEENGVPHTSDDPLSLNTYFIGRLVSGNSLRNYRQISDRAKRSLLQSMEKNETSYAVRTRTGHFYPLPLIPTYHLLDPKEMKPVALPRPRNAASSVPSRSVKGLMVIDGGKPGEPKVV